MMLRSIAWTFLFCAWLAFQPAFGGAQEPAGAAPETAPDTWHATTFVTGDMGFRIIHYWSKGDWMRAQTLIGGHPIVTIVRDGEYIGYDAMTGKGARIQRAPAAREEDRNRSRPFGNDLDELKKQGADKVEVTERAGRAVEIWRKTDAAGRRKLWVTSDEPMLPMRLETFVRGGSETITTEYSDWAKGLAIPDAFFAAPQGLDLEVLDYESYLEQGSTRPIGPVLYPDLLHGGEIP